MSGSLKIKYQDRREWVSDDWNGDWIVSCLFFWPAYGHFLGSAWISATSALLCLKCMRLKQNCAILLLDESKIGFVLLAWLTLACIVCEIVHRNFPISNKYLGGNYKIGKLLSGPGPGVTTQNVFKASQWAWTGPGTTMRLTLGRDNSWSQPDRA